MENHIMPHTLPEGLDLGPLHDTHRRALEALEMGQAFLATHPTGELNRSSTSYAKLSAYI